MTEKEIKAKYKKLHNELSNPFYAKKKATGVTPEEQAEFDTKHGKIWADMEAELITEGFLTLPEPPRDLPAEIAQLKAKYTELEQRIKMFEPM